MNPIEQNALYILKILVDNNTKRIGGRGLNELTGFDPRDINDAIKYLEDLDAVDVLKALGTSPYNFLNVEVKSRGRYLYYEIFSDEKRTILDENKIKQSQVQMKDVKPVEKTPKSDLKVQIIPERTYYPVGSPYGFTEDNWESVSLKKTNRNILEVVFGLQYVSDYYNIEDIIKNIKSYFEIAIENFNLNNPEEGNVKLKFRKLTAGYGEHVFNSIAESIIGSDIAIFEVSDNNPNVMIELGVALTWGITVLPLIEKSSSEIPSDISGQTWIKYEKSGEIIHDHDFEDKLNITVQRAIFKKG